MFRVLLPALAVVLGVFTYIWFISPAQRPQPRGEPAPITVAITPAERRDVPIVLTGIGTVQALNTVQIRSRVEGTLDRVNFSEGQQVQKGQVLATIDPRLYEAALLAAKAKKAQDEAQLVSDQKNLERGQQLATQRFASEQSLDQLTARVASGRALIEADNAAIRTAETNLGYTTIVAPFDGRIGLRGVDPGNIVRANDTAFIATLTQQDPISVVFTLPESQLVAVRRALSKGNVRATAFDQDGKTPLAVGTLEVIDNQVDQATGTIRLKAIFANKEEKLWPGQYTPVQVLIETRKNAITVPSAVIQRGPNGPYVWIANPEGRAVMSGIEMGGSHDGYTIIEKGVRDGDQIVTSNQYRLQPNVRIKPETRPIATNDASSRS